jgi:hypothetical protein
MFHGHVGINSATRNNFPFPKRSCVNRMKRSGWRRRGKDERGSAKHVNPLIRNGDDVM